MSPGPLYVFLGEVSVQVLCPFFNWVVCLPGLHSCEFFIYFGDQTPVWGIIGKHVFPYCWFSFYCNAVFFSHAEAFYFDEVPFVYSVYCVPCFKERCLWACCCMECLRFSCQCFPLGFLWCYDLYLSLLSILSLFLCMAKLVIKFHFFARSCPDLPTPSVEEAVFAPFYAPASFVKY